MKSGNGSKTPCPHCGLLNGLSDIQFGRNVVCESCSETFGAPLSPGSKPSLFPWRNESTRIPQDIPIGRDFSGIFFKVFFFTFFGLVFWFVGKWAYTTEKNVLMWVCVGSGVLFVSWYLFGFPEKKCPDCAEDVKSEASACKYCGHKFG